MTYAARGSQFDRDSEGDLIEVGTDFDVTAVLFGDVAIGYRLQDYDDSRFDTIEDVAGCASLTWNPRPDNGFRFDHSRRSRRDYS